MKETFRAQIILETDVYTKDTYPRKEDKEVLTLDIIKDILERGDYEVEVLFPYLTDQNGAVIKIKHRAMEAKIKEDKK